MMESKTFYLVHQQARRGCAAFALEAPDGWRVQFSPQRRSDDQNAKFHAICSDLARSGLAWAGKPRDASAWKVLLVSGHSMATKEGAEMVPGLEGEFVNLRESTSRMTKARGASLITYAIAFCDLHGVKLSNEAKAL